MKRSEEIRGMRLGGVCCRGRSVDVRGGRRVKRGGGEEGRLGVVR